MDELKHSDSLGRSAGGKRGMSPEWYLSPRIFEFEMEHLFQQAWVPVGYRCQLSKSGEFFLASVQNHHVVVLRDQHDQVRAFQNACRHRGTQLCTSADGQLNSAMICPYHGWKYDLNGQLVSAPHMQAVEGFRKSDFGLLEFAVRDWQGMLFVTTIGGQSAPPVCQLEEIATRYELSRYQVAREISYDVAANWKLIFQNFSECYHCPAVHPQLTPHTDFRDSANDFDWGPVLGGPMKIRNSAESVSVDGKFCGERPSEFPDGELKHARYYTVFPNLFLSLFPDYAMVHRLSPVDLGRTRIDCEFLFHPQTTQSPDFNPDNASEFWDLTNRQDWEMCERVQIGLANPGFQPGSYSNLESLLAAFDEYYLQQMRPWVS